MAKKALSKLKVDPSHTLALGRLIGAEGDNLFAPINPKGAKVNSLLVNIAGHRKGVAFCYDSDGKGSFPSVVKVFKNKDILSVSRKFCNDGIAVMLCTIPKDGLPSVELRFSKDDKTTHFYHRILLNNQMVVYSGTGAVLGTRPTKEGVLTEEETKKVLAALTKNAGELRTAAESQKRTDPNCMTCHM